MADVPMEITQDTIGELRQRGLYWQANLVLRERRKWLARQRQTDKALNNRQSQKIRNAIYYHSRKIKT